MKMTTAAKLRSERDASVSAPVDGLIKIKPKGRPRGKAFTKNNTYGVATRFKPGQSGNPNGRSSEEQRAASLLSKALIEVLPMVGNRASLKTAGRTFTQKLAGVWVEQGLKGNIAAIVAIADRIEGKPFVSMQVDGGPNQLAILIEGMHNVSKTVGHPEGWCPPPLLEAGEDAD
jgi:hypothetical protein